MTDYELIDLALKIARAAHKEQRQKDGDAYIYHPIMVALQCNNFKARVAGLLHDTIEDTDVTEEYLREKGIPEDILEAVLLLTDPYQYPSPEQYLEYVAKIKENPIAREVKLADLRNNMDVSRLPDPNMMALKREHYYKPALKLLTEDEKASQ